MRTKNSSEIECNFRILKKISQIPGSDTEILERGIWLLERISKIYEGMEQNSLSPEHNRFYSESYTMCKKSLERIKSYIKVEAYEQRLNSLSKYNNQTIQETDSSYLQEQKTNDSYLQEQKTNDSYLQEQKTNSLNLGDSSNQEEQPKYTQKRKKSNSTIKQISNPNKNQYNPLEKTAINILREVLLVDLRENYSNKKSTLKTRELKRIYEPQFNSAEGLLEILEGICNNETNVFADPVFIKINNLYNKEIEQITEKRLSSDDKEKFKELDNRYTKLMQEIDLIGQGIKELNNKRLIKLNKKRKKQRRKLDTIEPSDEELRKIESELEKKLRIS